MAEIESLDKQLAKILDEFKVKQLKPKIEEGLNKSSEFMLNQLKNEVKLGDSQPHFSESWYIKKNYKGIRMIKNSKKVIGKGKSGENKNIPLSAYLEHAVSSPYKGFIKRTVRRNKQAAIDVFKREFK